MTETINLNLSWLDVLKLLAVLIPSIFTTWAAVIKFLDRKSKSFDKLVLEFSNLVNNHINTQTVALTGAIEKFGELHHQSQIAHEKQITILEEISRRLDIKS